MKKLSSIIQEGPVQSFSKYINLLDVPTKKMNDRALSLEHYYGYSKEHEDTIAHYTNEGYLNLNHKLFLHHNEPHYVLHKDEQPFGQGEMGKLRENMDEITTTHKTPHALDVYSGIKKHFTPKKGDVYHHPGFMSTSLNRNTANNFKLQQGMYNDKTERYDEHEHILHIRLPKGHPGAYVDHYSSNHGEKEFILPRGMNLKHIHTHTYMRPSKPDKGEHYIHIHHMEPVTD